MLKRARIGGFGGEDLRLHEFRTGRGAGYRGGFGALFGVREVDGFAAIGVFFVCG